MVYTVHGILQAKILEWVPFPPPGDLPNAGIKPRSPTFQADSLPAEPQGKPKNTGVGSLCLLQGIFLIQELNQSLLPCRWILYQLSCQGSPVINIQHHIRQWHPTPALLPGKSHGWRSLEGCSPWGGWGSDTTERLHFHFYALEKEMATHSSVLAWRIPGTGEPGGLPSMGSHRVGHDRSNLAAAAAAATI